MAQEVGGLPSSPRLGSPAKLLTPAAARGQPAGDLINPIPSHLLPPPTPALSPHFLLPLGEERARSGAGEGTTLTLFPSGMPCWLAALPTLPPVGPGQGELQPADRKAAGHRSGASLPHASSFLNIKRSPQFPLGLRPILKSSSEWRGRIVMVWGVRLLGGY